MNDLEASFSGSRKSAKFFSYNLFGSPEQRKRYREKPSTMESRFNRIKAKAARVLRSPGSPEKKKEFPKSDDEDESAKPSGSKATKEKEEKKPERVKTPSKDQVEKWTSSINCLLSDPEGVQAFRDFLKGMEEESGEKDEFTKYIDFYMDCEGYKAEFKRLENNAKMIFEQYLAEYEGKAVNLKVGGRKKGSNVGADKEVGTGGKSVDIGDKLEEEGLEGVTLFDEPQKKVKQKLADGLYVNFCLYWKEKLKL